ncbi:MAG TPA: replication-associated recombination protein A [bacterium]|nr:replication-associated recombination protein A [bacterium]
MKSGVAAEAANTAMPLAARMRPRTLAEYAGQKEVIGEGKLLWRSLQSGRLSSCILYGPPGTGKTTLALLIARTADCEFVTLSAVTSNVDDLRKAIAAAKDLLKYNGRKTTLFIDEIHRFNKAQQDVLLPHVEDGTIVLIGATTQNPSFAVNAPLVSRSLIFRLVSLSVDEIISVMKRALADKERGLGAMSVRADDAALRHIAVISDGDARRALNALEIAALTTPPGPDGSARITLETAEESIQHKAVLYDRDGDGHYDTISAFIKSLRGSDPDAALYWLAKMIEAGEDVRFIARRMIIFASEDIGNADPDALTVAVSCSHAVEYVGLPEARISCAQAVTYLATAPKSNASYIGVEEALKDVREGRTLDVPDHLRNPATAASKRMGFGEDYKYPHDFDGHVVDQSYGVSGKQYYRPDGIGYEKVIAERLAQWKRKRKSSGS